MKITTGQYRGRPLKAPPGMDIRPTSDKVRQAIFNILGGYGLPDGAVVIDAFCGTGALGLEALSRGAQLAVFMDIAQDSLQCCRSNIASLKVEERSIVMRSDTTKPGAKPVTMPTANLVFLDPPYRKNLIAPALEALGAGGWLAEDALIVAEAEKNAGLVWPEGFSMIDSRVYSDTEITFLRHKFL